MKSVRSLVGMPVISRSAGRKLGRVLRCSVDEALTSLDGLWMAGRFGKTVFLPKESVDLLGDVSVIAGGSAGRKPDGSTFSMRRALDTSGSLIGAIVGLMANEETLAIEALVLSRGFWEDLASGRQLVRHYAVVQGGDVIVSGKGEDEHEEGNHSRDDCRGDDRSIGGNGIRYDELAHGAEARKGRYECRKNDHGENA